MLTPTTIGTAHKKLPCGTTVTFTHAGRSVTATVIDRGPYNKGYAWDLTKKTAKRVGFLAVGVRADHGDRHARQLARRSLRLRGG